MVCSIKCELHIDSDETCNRCKYQHSAAAAVSSSHQSISKPLHKTHLMAPRANREGINSNSHSCIIAAVQTPFIIAFHTIQVAPRRNNTCPPSATINIRYRISTWPSVQSDDAAELNDHLSLSARSIFRLHLGSGGTGGGGCESLFLPHTSGRKRRRSKFNVTRRDGYARAH
jgi:hypothetical protein